VRWILALRIDNPDQRIVFGWSEQVAFAARAVVDEEHAPTQKTQYRFLRFTW
jgi:hypothetical protein